MDKDRRYSLNAVNTTLKADKQMALYNYYINRAHLTTQIQDDKIKAIDKTIKDYGKRKVHYENTYAKYRPVADAFRAQAQVHFDNWERLINSLKPDTEGQNNELSQEETNEDQ